MTTADEMTTADVMSGEEMREYEQASEALLDAQDDARWAEETAAAEQPPSTTTRNRSRASPTAKNADRSLTKQDAQHGTEEAEASRREGRIHPTGQQQTGR